MVKPKVYADFNNADASGRLRLHCVGTVEDLARQQITLHDGMLLTLYMDDADAGGRLDELMVDGVVSFSEDEHCWVAAIDWGAIHHASEEHGASKDGAKHSSHSLASEKSQTRHS